MKKTIKEVLIRLKKKLTKKPFDKERDKVYLWFAKSTEETGTKLAQSLNIDGGRKPPSNKYKYVICWGTKDINPNVDLKTLAFPLENFKFINSYTAVQNNRNKFRSLGLMKKGKVRVPRYIKKDNILNELRDKNFSYPLIARTNRHQGGNGLIMCLNSDDLKRALDYDYFMEYIPSKVEFRVHIFDGKPIRISKKVNGYVEENYYKDYWIKNRARGWSFKDIEVNTLTEWDKSIVDECKKAVKSMDMVFGAVDVIYSDFNIPYVIEVNSAPALNDFGLGVYTENIKDYFNKNFKEVKK